MSAHDSLCHCGEAAPIRGEGDPWEGRMDGYCYECALNRCDCYPDECPVKYAARLLASSSLREDGPAGNDGRGRAA